MAQIPTPAFDGGALATRREQVRIDSAACHRLAVEFGMTDLIYTHISHRLPETHDRFLINPFGLLFEEVCADNLVTVTAEGEVVDDPTGLGINRAGFVIHSAIHMAREDACCVMHTHTPAGVAVSSLACGLQAITQHAAGFHNRIGYHDYEGVAMDLGERERLVRNLGIHATGQPIAQPAPDAVERAARLFENALPRSNPRLWEALKRRLERSQSASGRIFSRF